MDLSTILGLIIGIGGILAGNALEGGHFNSLIQLAAFLIVFGGTLGATMLSNTMTDLGMALKMVGKTFKRDDDSRTNTICNELVAHAKLARKESILALEKQLPKMSSPFMRSVFRFLIDGVDGPTLKEIFATEIDNDERRKLSGAKVWTDAGGYAPTIGIIGAVLGLITVMANLSDTSKLGQGIAVAFVATIYGVGAANLIFLPIATKIKRKIEKETLENEMILDGAVSIISGLNPYIVEQKIRSYQNIPASKGSSKK